MVGMRLTQNYRLRKRRFHTARLLLVLAAMCLCAIIQAQGSQAKTWASVTLNKSTVVVGEPLIATYTIYTTTWFSSPPVIGEIQVPEAMMVRFAMRSGSVSRTIGGQRYSGIVQKFVVYPTRVGENVLPEVEIEVSTPPEGDYKPRTLKIKSPERRFEVKGVPASDAGQTAMLAARSVTWKENWSSSTDGAKVGDVIERTITITANGPVAALIPPMPLEQNDCYSSYPAKPILRSSQNNNDFSGVRIEKHSYLLTQAGDCEIPGMDLGWYNYTKGTQELISIPAKILTVVENPDLEFVMSMQDSLNKLLAEEQFEDAESEPWSLFGLNWWQFVAVSLLIVAIALWLAKVIARVSRQRQARRASSKPDSATLLRHFEAKCKARDPAGAFTALNNWFMVFKEEMDYDGSLGQWMRSSGDDDLVSRFEAINEMLFSSSRDQRESGPDEQFCRLVSQAIHAMHSSPATGNKHALVDLNP